MYGALARHFLKEFMRLQRYFSRKILPILKMNRKLSLDHHSIGIFIIMHCNTSHLLVDRKYSGSVDIVWTWTSTERWLLHKKKSNGFQRFFLHSSPLLCENRMIFPLWSLSRHTATVLRGGTDCYYMAHDSWLLSVPVLGNTSLPILLRLTLHYRQFDLRRTVKKQLEKMDQEFS